MRISVMYRGSVLKSSLSGAIKQCARVAMDHGVSHFGSSLWLASNLYDSCKTARNNLAIKL